MFPVLFKIGSIPVYSYGLMLGISFLIGSSLINRELRRLKMDENMGITLTFIALVAGIIGSKLFYIIEEWNFGQGLPFSTLMGSDVIFSSSGLTFYGGLILSILSVIVYAKIKNISALKLFDIMSPPLALAYGIARIGCHLAGDGDYGITVNGTMWEFIGYSYLNGTVPTKPGQLVHPTSIYELITGTLIFLYLWGKRARRRFNGEIFSQFLILSGISRLLIEFIRLNPKVVFGLSQAQLISIGLIIIGVVIYMLKSGKTEEQELKTA